MAVYFVQAVDGGPIKIGHSVDVDARLKQLEATYGRPLALLATMPGGRDEEQAIHDRFSSLRFGRTEQFRPERELLDFIGRPLFVSDMPVVEPMENRGNVIAITCRQAFKDWAEELADKHRTTPSQLFDIAMFELAKVRGFELPPPRLKPANR